MRTLRSRLEHLRRTASDAARDVLRQVEQAYKQRGQRAAASAPAASQPATTAPPRPAAPSWELRPAAELVDHLEQHYHASLRRELPELIAAARQLERAHASHPSVPSGLCDLLATLAAELDAHMNKEETMLFPELRRGARGGPIEMPIRMMERDHDGHADALEQIRELTDSLTAPADAPPTWRALYDRLELLETELHQHIYLEDHVLFARATGG